jgi:CheY-like chemotaxis protein
VTLPTVPADAISEGLPSVPAPAGSVEPRARILVVDDEPAVGGVVALVLGREHAVTLVTSGEAAVAQLEAGERFDAILCDVMMPKLGGPAVHERIRELDAEQAERMVFMSGGVFSPDAYAYLARPPNARLDKPFTAEQLRLVVREVTVAGRAPEDAARSPRRIPLA